MTYEQAESMLLKKNPGRVVSEAAEYDKNNFVMVLKNPGEKERNNDDPNFLVNKKTGSIKQFNPASVIDTFLDAFDNRRIK